MDSEFLDISTSLPLQLGYGVGHVLNDVCASLWFTYLLVYFHLVLEFSASQAGTLMLIGQVVDALATPFVGYHSDHTYNTFSRKYGKRKLWHLFGTTCILASFPFIFSKCVGCSMTHKWAQMYYFASFIMIFQIGWAAVQISHLSLIPELSSDGQTRTHITAIRFGFTVFSNLFVYVVTWATLHFTGECNQQQIGPEDAWKFRNIVLIVISVGSVACLIFHVTVHERHQHTDEQQLIQEESSTHVEFLKRPILYQVAGIYMSTRLTVNVSQVLIPLYLHLSLGLAARALAVIPLATYLGSLAAAGVQRIVPFNLPKKICYLIGSASALTAFIWIFYGSGNDYKSYYIYIVAVFVGFGGAIMLVTSLTLTADLVGSETKISAFVYGVMSFTDKLSCGIAIAVIQQYADGADVRYYKYTLSLVCGCATIIGLVLTLLLPQLNEHTNNGLRPEDPSINTLEQSRDSEPVL